jgi:hypothetical protein
MAKKVKGPVKNYQVKDLVVVKTLGWNNEVPKYEIGMITNKRYATQLTKTTYDIRTEGGTGLIYTSVDDPKSRQTIVSNFTEAWLADGGSNNMWIHKRDGHTRANYKEGMELRYDGQSSEKKEVVKPETTKVDDIKVKSLPPLVVGQFEKYNDFVFPTQGPRSF